MLRVFVITNDHYLWALSPFSYLFNKYWGEKQEVVVMGYRLPSFELPPNFRFHSISRVNYPQDRWSTALIQFLNQMEDDYFVFMLEDYWINRPVDIKCINTLHQYMASRQDILRFDLTCDVLYSNGDARDAYEAGFVNHYDIVEKLPGMAYRMSFQSGLWNKKLLLSLLKDDKDPWECEMYTSIPDSLKVYGTRQWPLRYINAIYKKELDLREIEKLHKNDLEKVRASFPKDISYRKYNK